MKRLPTRMSLFAMAVVLGTVGAKSTFAFAKTYCPVSDFIEVCLKEDQPGMSIGKRKNVEGWKVSYSTESEPEYIGIYQKASPTGFAIREISYSDSFTQNCAFEYWRAISHGIKAYCSQNELRKLDKWASANDAELIAESQSPKPELPRFTQKGLNKIWKMERGTARMSIKLGADEFDKGQPLVANILSVRKIFLTARKEQQ